MTDLAEFLSARLEEDEAVARGAQRGPWLAREAKTAECDELAIVTADGGTVVDSGYEGGGVWSQPDADHITRHDPARVLREVEAGRARLALMIEAHAEMDRLLADKTSSTADCALAVGRARGATVAVKHDAAVHAAHPDYMPEWKP
jgi:hypothetical protein